MYAVIKSGAHQYKATIGSELIIERLPHAIGEQVEIDEVYLLADGDDIQVGKPTIESAKVLATIVEEFRGPKIFTFKYHPRKRYRRRKGHRQTYMRLRIDDIVKGA